MNIVVISAHPDDEVLGCGGTLIKHNQNGDKIFWIITTSIFESMGFSPQKVEERNTEIEKVKNFMGIENIYKLEYPTTTLDSSTLVEMVPKISTIFSEIKPNVIYVMNRSDAHSDHRITFQAIMASTKSFRHPYIRKILMYECLSETEFAPSLPENVFQPNYFVDVTDTFQKKLECMSIYKSEIDEHPFPRSYRNIKALATYRGAMIGVDYAESYQLLKFIDL